MGKGERGEGRKNTQGLGYGSGGFERACIPGCSDFEMPQDHQNEMSANNWNICSYGLKFWRPHLSGILSPIKSNRALEMTPSEPMNTGK